MLIFVTPDLSEISFKNFTLFFCKFFFHDSSVIRKSLHTLSRYVKRNTIIIIYEISSISTKKFYAD